MVRKTFKINQDINWFILIELLLFTAMVWFTCYEKAQITSMAFALSFLVLLYGFVKYTLDKIRNLDSIDTYLFVIILFSFASVLLSFIKAGRLPGFESLKSYFIFLSTIIFFRLSAGIKVNKKMCNIIFIFHIGISLVYFYAKRTMPYSEDFNFGNPNFMSMFVFVSLVYMVLAFMFYKNIVMKLICALLAVSDFVIMYETEARNVLIAFVLFAVIVILTLFRGNIRYSKAFNFFVNITPAAFVAVYLTFIDKISASGWFDFLVSEGKNLTSRVEIWKRFLGKIDGMWLTGDYVNALGNSHNSHMVLLCSFGVIVMVLVTIYIYKLVNEISNNITDKFQTYCLAAFFAIIFMGFGEGALYSGGIGIYIPCGLFLVLANSNFEQKEIIEDKSFYNNICRN